VIERFEATPCTTDGFELGECCRWDELRQELCWVDVSTGRLFRARASGENVQVVHTYELDAVSAFAPMAVRSEGWIVASGRSLSQLSEGGLSSELAAIERGGTPPFATNDGSADPWGRFWIGVMDPQERDGLGHLYRYHPSTGVERVLSGLTISNGLGWSPDRRTMYYVDSGPGSIYRFRVDQRGEISDQETFATFDVAREGTPDGLCVDAEGAIWVAIWGGYHVRRYAPSGEELARVNVATAQPSSCSIGGDSGSTLYVTTATQDMSREALEREPQAGMLFCAEVAVSGLPLDSYDPLGRA